MEPLPHRTNFRCASPRIGQATLTLVAAIAMPAPKWRGPGARAIAALSAALVVWGFTVDDALISIRYARHLASGEGYRFNAAGPSTDGVTPLPWPFVVAIFARSSTALAVLTRLKVLGVTLHAIAIAIVSLRVSREAESVPNRGWLTAALAIAACLPFAAYGASGMETPLATLLCASCVVYDKDLHGPLFAGLAASIRPELMPWAFSIAVGFAIARRASVRAVVASAARAAAPFVACALARRAIFGHFAPLAVLAKPSDVSHGFAYAVAGVLACGVPIFLIVRRAPPTARVIAIAFAVHVLAVIAAGGDSMPYARLFVPLVPTVILAHLYSASTSRGPVFWLRSTIAIGLASWAFFSAGPRGRAVTNERAALVTRAEPVFAHAHAIAAVDIGWVSAAYEGTIVDLAGLTDPEIAALAGGHTSKHVDASMLLDRGVDTVVFYTEDNLYTHAVAVRLASDPLFSSRFAESANLFLTERSGYVVFTRRALAWQEHAPSSR